ncbi:zinc finger-containing ubiquitin peptidase 1 isoform X2 [Ambystoma mexicanum]|uniref:zinc finger-containing ubiquitin peptidase 1 isoform X2 n=1 Tax=Ambystoma mexicanum TaxID=8296 RepID=UPI0037E7729F
MLHCDICGQQEQSEDDMKSHLLVSHVEGELSCPLCCLSGVTYDQMTLHIDTAHFEAEGESHRGGEHLGLRFNRSPESDFFDKSNVDSSKTNNTEGRIPNSRSVPYEEVLSTPQLLRDSTEICNAAHATHSTATNYCVGSEPQCNLAFSKQQDSRSSPLLSSQLGHGPLQCPFCSNEEDNVQDIELHVQTEHADLLKTPTKGIGLPCYECPFCQLVCSNCHILQEHVNLHLEESIFPHDTAGSSRDFTLAKQLQEEENQKRRSEESRKEQEQFQTLQRQYGLDNSGGYKKQSMQNMERAVAQGRMQPYEYHVKKAEMLESLAIGVDNGQTKTSGVLQVLSQYYQNCGQDVKRVWLCSPLDHFFTSLGDKGWGCGYRNFQMLLSSLLKNGLFACLKDMPIPCIPKIQLMIENSWKEGFDPQGATHFNHKLQGTKAWIGACEIYSLLSSLNLKCRIVDFHKATGPSGTHPLLFQWVLNYFSSGGESQKVVCTSRSPIYLQHQAVQLLD